MAASVDDRGGGRDATAPTAKLLADPVGDPRGDHRRINADMGGGGMAKPPLTVPIAGAFFQRGAAKALAKLALGAPLQLIREPGCPQDPLAIQVWTDDGQVLGYVPKVSNVDLAWALDGGVPVKAVFAGYGRDRQPAMQIVWP
jgi:hypothetical protein